MRKLRLITKGKIKNWNFFSEVLSFLNYEIKSDMMVDISHKDDQLNINIDIFFPKLPCDILGLDV